MKNKNKLFENILLALNKAGILQDIILIGSWVLPVYKYHFSNSAGIPILRTTDIDFFDYKSTRNQKESRCFGNFKILRF